MDKILFSNSFKNLMVALGAKTSDSSYAVPLINKTSGAPQGYMEMSALASVLGAVQRTGQSITIEANGSYNVTSSSVNEMCGLWEIYESTNYGAKMIVNIAFNAGGSTYPGVDIISSPDGMERGISVTKENGFNSFTINNLTNNSLTLRIRRI